MQGKNTLRPLVTAALGAVAALCLVMPPEASAVGGPSGTAVEFQRQGELGEGAGARGRQARRRRRRL